MADNSAPLPNVESYIQQIEKLQEEMQKKLPGYEYTLREIHRNLSADPAIAHLLPPEKIGTIVSALKMKTGVFIASQTVRSKTGSGGKRLKDITEDDI